MEPAPFGDAERGERSPVQGAEEVKVVAF